MKINSTYLFIALIVVVVLGIGLARHYSPGASGSSVTTEFDGFAECLDDAGAKFYGAYWCPHCQDQKAMFENSKKLPYIECSTPDGQGQTKECVDEGITGYPTWKFSDGSELGGAVPLADLAEKTGCELPL